jgi:hypothetical protein
MSVRPELRIHDCLRPYHDQTTEQTGLTTGLPAHRHTGLTTKCDVAGGRAGRACPSGIELDGGNTARPSSTRRAGRRQVTSQRATPASCQLELGTRKRPARGLSNPDLVGPSIQLHGKTVSHRNTPPPAATNFHWHVVPANDGTNMSSSRQQVVSHRTRTGSGAEEWRAGSQPARTDGLSSLVELSDSSSHRYLFPILF